MKINGNQWKSIKIDENPCKSMKMHENHENPKACEREL
jgi:hypothetical protein